MYVGAPPPIMIWSPQAFLALGGRTLSAEHQRRQGWDEGLIFRSSYGVSHDVCSHVWEYMHQHRTKPEQAMPKHLLWALLFLKTYETEVFLCALVGTTTKSFRKWIWLIVEAINQLYGHVVSVLCFCGIN